MDNNLTVIENWENLNDSLGICGSIALNRRHELELKSAPCESTNMRFMCEYCKYMFDYGLFIKKPHLIFELL